MVMRSETGQDQFTLRRRPWSERSIDGGFRLLTILLASLVAVVLLGIFLTVFNGAQEAMASFGLSFLVTSGWNPVNNQYGAFTAIYGTLVSSLLALFIAVPLGVGTAIFITENLIPRTWREVIGVMVELLAAIPSVVLGLWAIFVMEPLLRPFLNFLHQSLGWFPLFSTVPKGPGMAPAILILVVMILPIITAISRDALNQVPQELRQGLRRGQHPLDRHLQCDPAGGHLLDHRRGDAGPGPGHGRNHGCDHDHRQLDELQLVTAGPGKHHLGHACQPVR